MGLSKEDMDAVPGIYNDTPGVSKKITEAMKRSSRCQKGDTVTIKCSGDLKGTTGKITKIARPTSSAVEELTILIDGKEVTGTHQELCPFSIAGKW
jgi:hypothetical protein